ncbi:DsrH/TusB family sulfur metabolism protein [Alteromonas lipotrueiana]|uniref:DsrH/TusB family sulfur metabolism protein n=1 Tax=Alteromonas lipotrueiana TaxID=2803815 RepID=UPI001C496EE5|nr:DsrH/TusB family sulfur metabolism protein [Alteromonas lipotrueiana]
MLMVLQYNNVNYDLNQQLSALTQDDVVLLMSDAVYLTICGMADLQAQIVVYEPDALARGVAVSCGYKAVSSDELVRLNEKYSTWIKW